MTLSPEDAAALQDAKRLLENTSLAARIAHAVGTPVEKLFGMLPAGASDVARMILIDEVLTPDSSRFWPRDHYQPGGPQPSFDKQYVRDYLERIQWNKQPPVPSLPDDVVRRTREKYVEAFRLLSGAELQ